VDVDGPEDLKLAQLLVETGRIKLPHMEKETHKTGI
jgi:hypothetical protein